MVKIVTCYLWQNCELNWLDLTSSIVLFHFINMQWWLTHQFFSGSRTPSLYIGKGGVELFGGGRHHLHRLLAARLHHQGYHDGNGYDGGDGGDGGCDWMMPKVLVVRMMVMRMLNITSSSMDGLACSSSTSSTWKSRNSTKIIMRRRRRMFISVTQVL